jgi:raffinose/stachyose/melibiose transport system permease protein
VLLGLGKWTFLIFLFVYAVFPVLWLAVASLKTNGELMANPFSLPQVWQFQNYKKALAVSGIARLMLNSVLISTAATFLNVLIASMAAYTLSRFRFRGNQVLKVMFSSGILIPLNALMIPYFVLINSLGLYNTMGGLILVYTAIGIPISTFIIMGFMASVPEELEEAAIIDGACFYKRFFTLVFPLSRAGVVTAGTFQFLTCWNEFVYANLLTSSQAVRTVQLGIRYFTNQFATDYVSMYAAIIISILPSIAAYVLFQNQIIAGLTSGALKG